MERKEGRVSSPSRWSFASVGRNGERGNESFQLELTEDFGNFLYGLLFD